jgi:hypothetical protein
MMKLQLQWHPQPRRTCCAALLHGSQAEDWLRKLSEWDIPLTKMKGYVLPQSLSNPEASALLVVFADQPPPMEMVQHPYGKIGGKLYVPLHADLWPAVTQPELDAMLLYPVQVWHPGIGIVGYEVADELPLRSLLAFAQPPSRQWFFAAPPLPPLPPLSKIGIELPPAAELLTPGKEGLGDKPLSDLAPPKTPQEESALDNLKRGLFAGIAGGASMLSGLFGDGGGKGGLLDDLGNWASRNLEDLQRQRETALEKLLKLFESNPEEALRYALPLSNPYESRGTAPPGTSLPPRDTNFNLGGLSGGRPTDAWDASKFQEQLRRKYLDAANQAIADGDFRRAAYIYAHLLGDFSSAANVLRQGKHYVESAALYRDHLKNLSMAATVLEEGGHLGEAAEIRLSLKEYQRAGDLFRKAQQEDRAMGCYQMALAEFLEKHQYKNAGILALDKLQDRELALRHFWTGWESGANDARDNLRHYLRHHNLTEEQLARRIDESLAADKTMDQQYDLLSTLVEHLDQHPMPIVRKLGLDRTYGLLAWGMRNRSIQPYARLLSRFLPEDALIPQDVSRYQRLLSKPQPVPPKKPVPTEDQLLNMRLNHVVQLDTDFAWQRLIDLGEICLALGTNLEHPKGPVALALLHPKGGRPQYAYGELTSNDPVFFYENKNGKGTLYTGGIQFVPQDERFGLPAFQLAPIQWLPPQTLALTFKEDTWYVLHDQSDKVHLSLFSVAGNLQSTHSISLHPALITKREGGHPNIFLHNHAFVFGYSNAVIRLESKASSHFDQQVFKETVRNIAVAEKGNFSFWIATDSGIRACLSMHGQMKEDLIDPSAQAKLMIWLGSYHVAMLERTPWGKLKVFSPEGTKLAEVISDDHFISMASSGVRGMMNVLNDRGEVKAFWVGR